MKNRILVIEEEHIDNAKQLLKSHRIKFYEAGFPNGKVELIETYESEMNSTPIKILKKVEKLKKIKQSEKTSSRTSQKEHNQLVSFAKQLGRDSIGSAVAKVGSGIAFRRKFKKEFVLN